MNISVEEIVLAGQLIENELTVQVRRLRAAIPRDEGEAIYLTNMIRKYEESILGVHELWTHQQRRLDKLAEGAVEAIVPYSTATHTTQETP